MALSDFLNGYTSVSLYSRYSLSSHSVRVAHKKCCVAQITLCQQKMFYIEVMLPAKIMWIIKKYAVATKNIMWHQKEEAHVDFNMFSVAQKRNTCWQKFMLYINIYCID